MMTTDESVFGIALLLLIAIVALILRDKFYRQEEDPDVIEVWPLIDDDEEDDHERRDRSRH